MIRLAFLCCCLFVSSFSIAEELEDIYQVDVLFFEHLDPKRFDTEKWPKTIAPLNTAKAVSLNSIATGKPDALDVLTTLDAVDSVGSKPVAKIIPETITLVEPQNMFLKEEATIVKNSKNQRFIQQYAWMQPVATYVESTPILIQGGKANKEIQAVVELKPAKNQINASVNIIYTTDHSNRQGVKEFRISKDFKLKKKEIYYVDHPVVGMIIVVTPVLVNQ